LARAPSSISSESGAEQISASMIPPLSFLAITEMEERMQEEQLVGNLDDEEVWLLQDSGVNARRYLDGFLPSTFMAEWRLLRVTACAADLQIFSWRQLISNLPAGVSRGGPSTPTARRSLVASSQVVLSPATRLLAMTRGDDMS
jgi:hypothetical protein